jgi:hypothetical protein
MEAVTIIITIFILVISTIGFYILIWPQIRNNPTMKKDITNDTAIRNNPTMKKDITNDTAIRNNPTMKKDITNDCAQQCSNMASSKRPQCLTWCKSKFGI